MASCGLELSLARSAVTRTDDQLTRSKGKHARKTGVTSRVGGLGAGTALLSASSVFRMGSMLAATVLLGRSAGPGSIGDFTLVLATVAVLQAISLGGISGAALHKLVLSESNRDGLIETIVAARMVLVPPVFSLAAITYVALGDRSISENAAIAFVILSYGVGAFDVTEIYRNSRSEYRLIATRRCAVVLALLPVKCAAAWDGQLELVLIAQGIEAALWQLILVPWEPRCVTVVRRAVGRFSEGASEIWELRSLWLSGITSVLATRADVYVVALFVGVSQLGQYSTASRFVEAASIVAVAATTVIFNDLARSARVGSDYATKSRASARQILGLSTLCTLSLAVFGPYLIVLLYGPAFETAADLVPLYALTLIPLFQRQLISKILVIEKEYRLSLVSNVVGLALNVAMNLVLVPWLGLVGAAIAAVASYTLAVFLTFLPTRRGRQILAVSIGALIFNDHKLARICAETISVRRGDDEQKTASAPAARHVEA